MARMPAILVVAAIVAVSLGAHSRAAGDAAPRAANKQQRPAGAPRKPVVYRVGRDRELRVPSHAASLVRDGDVVLIDAGEYRDCAVWRANRLTLRSARCLGITPLLAARRISRSATLKASVARV